MVFCSPGSHEAIRTVPYRPTTVTLLRTPVRRIPTRITPVVWTQCTMLVSSEIWLTSLSIPRSSPRHDRILQAATPAALACAAWMPTSPPRLWHAGVNERERRPLGTGSTVSVHEADYDQVGEHS